MMFRWGREKALREELERKVEERMRELRQSEAQVQQLQKLDAIGRLAGGVAHDFNNLLGAITMYCDLIADELGKLESVKEAVRKELLENVDGIRVASERGAALTRQLLVFSRRQVTHPQCVELNTLITQLQNMLTRVIGENIRIVTTLAPELKPIWADPGQLEQVVLNLVVNARDAMPKGGSITISTVNATLGEGEYVQLSVADTGCGMDEATKGRLFEPFFTTKDLGKGSGLGLSTAYGIVKESRGTISVQSEPGKGSVFKIHLPAMDVVEEPGAGSVAEPGASASPAISREREATILLVEDEVRLRQVYSEMLRRKGYEVLVAANAEEALRLFEGGAAVDVLLSDVVMPGMGGFELARKASAFRKELRVILMSGYAGETVESLREGIDDGFSFLQKPFNSKALLARVEEALRVLQVVDIKEKKTS